MPRLPNVVNSRSSPSPLSNSVRRFVLSWTRPPLSKNANWFSSSLTELSSSMDRSTSVTQFLRGPSGRIFLFVICVKTIEEMFGDMKGNGFDLETTHLRDTNKLNRLTL